MTEEMQSVFLVVQEAPGESPSTATVAALSGEAALARVPEMAKDFYGEIPKQLVTWRIERLGGLWTIFACEWSGQAGEVNAPLRDIPTQVLVLLMRYAGANDGVENAIDSGRMLIDLDGAAKQCLREFPDARQCWEGVPLERRALAEFAYANAWANGMNDALNAKYRHRLSAKKGRT